MDWINLRKAYRYLEKIKDIVLQENFEEGFGIIFLIMNM